MDTSLVGLKVLIACERSGVVRSAFREAGHRAWSCDLVPADDGSQYHLQCDVKEVLDFGWDLMIAHPPCDHLAVSGARWFKYKLRQQEESLQFVRALLEAPIPCIALENPVSVISTRIRKPSQIVQPWMFGHPEQKKTCLWLKGLQPLQETDNVYEKMMTLPKKERERTHYMSPGKDRGVKRSVTFIGLAQAMVEQWGTAVPGELA